MTRNPASPIDLPQHFGSPPPKARELYERLGFVQSPDRAHLLRILAHFVWPDTLLGKGANAWVFVNPDDPEQVLKLTSDDRDAKAAIVIRELQLAGDRGILDATVQIIDVASWPEHNLWAIEAERVEPLVPHLMRVYSGPCAEKFIKLYDELYDWDLARIEQDFEKYEDLVEQSRHDPDTARELNNVMVRLAGRLKSAGKFIAMGQPVRTGMLAWPDSPPPRTAQKAHKIGCPETGKLLTAMGAAIETLRDRGFMIIDLHSGNWGVRHRGGRALGPVVLDFGFSQAPPVNETKHAWGEFR